MVKTVDWTPGDVNTKPRRNRLCPSTVMESWVAGKTGWKRCKSSRNDRNWETKISFREFNNDWCLVFQRQFLRYDAVIKAKGALTKYWQLMMSILDMFGFGRKTFQFALFCCFFYKNESI